MKYKKYIIELCFCLIIIVVILLLNTFQSDGISIVSVKTANNLGISNGFGIVYKKDKYTYIVTNYHVVAEGQKIVVTYSNKVAKAKIVNSDEYEDIAILRVKNDSQLKKASFAYNYSKQDIVKVKQFNRGKYITGNILNKDTMVPVKLSDGSYLIKTIELNLNLKPGNSGSPLYNKRNKIIGIISMQNVDAKNISYALDIKRVLKIARKLEKETIIRPDLEVELASTSNKQILEQYGLNNYNIDGVIVTQNYNSNVLKVGDIITNINNTRVKDILHFKYYLYNSNKAIKLKIYRKGKYVTKKVKI